jgi:hypothetical protein
MQMRREVSREHTLTAEADHADLSWQGLSRRRTCSEYTKPTPNQHALGKRRFSNSTKVHTSPLAAGSGGSPHHRMGCALNSRDRPQLFVRHSVPENSSSERLLCVSGEPSGERVEARLSVRALTLTTR